MTNKEAIKQLCAHYGDVGKDCPVIDKAIEALKAQIYNAGYNDAKREIALSGEYERAYQRGLNDAWECARKIYNDLSAEECAKIFEGKSWFNDFTAIEVIAKIKEYEEK